MSETMVRLTIDGLEVEVPSGTLLVDAAKTVGIDIPVFCYHPKLEPVGMCRMCLVEVGTPKFDREKGEVIRDEHGDPIIDFWPKLATACTTPVSEGMVVEVESQPAVRGREQIVEYLLTSHPLDCPICDKGGECPLQNLTMQHGPGVSRFIFEDKMNLDKHVPLGELIFLDRERCIQCARCVRFQEEIVADPVLTFGHRGRHLEIMTFSEPGFDSYFSGNTTDICPVGALTTADFRFGARPWEMNTAASICPHCPVGCNLSLSTRREAKSGGDEVVKRVMPRQNEWVNEIWICDKGRFSHHFAASLERITHPLVRKDGELVQVSWDEALERVADGFRAAGDPLVGLTSGRPSNEDLFSFQQLVTKLGGNPYLYDSLAGGAYADAYGVSSGTNLSEMGPGDAILVILSDLHEEAPIWWLRVKQAAERGATLVTLNARPTRLDGFAAFHLESPYQGIEAKVVALLNAAMGRQPAGGGSESEAIGLAGKSLAEASNLVIFYGSEGLLYQESESLVRTCMQLLDETGHVGRKNNGLIPVWPRGNTQGAWDVGLRPIEGDLEGTLKSSAAAYFLAVDPIGDDPALAEALQDNTFLVVQELFLTSTAEVADVVLPAQSFIEREGTFTSGERRVQRFYPAVPRQGEALPDWEITSKMAEIMGIELKGTSAAGVFLELTDQTKVYEGLNYPALADAPDQWPDVGGEDVYFGGTSYRNLQGIGVQLPHDTSGFQLLPLDLEVQPKASGDGEILLVPVANLYDRGILNRHTTLLKDRLAPAVLKMNGALAADLSVQDGVDVEVHVNGHVHLLPVQVDESIPADVVVTGLSQELPIREPTYVGIKPTGVKKKT